MAFLTLCWALVKQAGAGSAPAPEHHTVGAFWHVSDSANPKIDALEYSDHKLSIRNYINRVQEPEGKHCPPACTSLYTSFMLGHLLVKHSWALLLHQRIARLCYSSSLICSCFKDSSISTVEEFNSPMAPTINRAAFLLIPCTPLSLPQSFSSVPPLSPFQTLWARSSHNTVHIQNTSFHHNFWLHKNSLSCSECLSTV